MTNEQNVSPSITPVVDNVSTTETPTQSVQTSTPEVQPSASQKVFNEDQVRIISNNAKKAAERDLEARIRAEYETKYRAIPSLDTRGDNSSAPGLQQAPQSGNIHSAGLDEEQLYQNFRQRQEREQNEYQQQQTANDFLMKVQAAGKGAKIESSGIGNLPLNHPLVHMFNSLENIGDVIDDLADNPVKVANLLAVTHLNPINGIKALQDISTSVKRNKEALAKEKPTVPLNQLKPTGLGLSNSELSTSDKRKGKLFRF